MNNRRVICDVLPCLFVLAALAGLLALAGCSDSDMNPLNPDTDGKARGDDYRARARSEAGAVVVANRGSGSISVIDGLTGQLLGTHMLPMGEGDSMPEPMYVNGIAAGQRVFVGDRANDRVVVFDARNYEVVGMVPAGRGVFHQWVDRQGKQLWVNNDIDNTITVIDPSTLMVVATIALPADLVAMGGKPHDVVTDHFGRYAYVTMLGFAGENDYLLQYDARSFTEMNRPARGQGSASGPGQEHRPVRAPPRVATRSGSSIPRPWSWQPSSRPREPTARPSRPTGAGSTPPTCRGAGPTPC